MYSSIAVQLFPPRTIPVTSPHFYILHKFKEYRWPQAICPGLLSQQTQALQEPSMLLLLSLQCSPSGDISPFTLSIWLLGENSANFSLTICQYSIELLLRSLCIYRWFLPAVTTLWWWLLFLSLLQYLYLDSNCNQAPACSPGIHYIIMDSWILILFNVLSPVFITYFITYSNYPKVDLWGSLQDD